MHPLHLKYKITSQPSFLLTPSYSSKLARRDSPSYKAVSPRPSFSAHLLLFSSLPLLSVPSSSADGAGQEVGQGSLARPSLPLLPARPIPFSSPIPPFLPFCLVHLLSPSSVERANNLARSRFDGYLRPSLPLLARPNFSHFSPIIPCTA